MLKQLVNEARFSLTITAEGPVLVKSGYPTLVGPDMTPVLTYRDRRWEVYLPGSSLKGVCRSHVERLIRTLRRDAVVVCDPFVTRNNKEVTEGKRDLSEQSCGDWFEARKKANNDKPLPNAQVYRESCPACRLFGSTSFIGRLSISDAYLPKDSFEPRPTETRDGVGIDRLTGGAAGRVKFDLEVVSSGTEFTSEVVLRNFEVWQLGALMLTAQDFADGLIRVGSGRSRGLGAVKGRVQQVTISHFGATPGREPTEIWGLGNFLKPSVVYGTKPDDILAVGASPETHALGIRQEQTFAIAEGDVSLPALQRSAIEAFVSSIRDWPGHMSGASHE